MLSYTISNILLHVILISSFLVIFFFTYAAGVERQIVERQSKAVVNDVISDIIVLLPEPAINDIGAGIQSITPPNMEEEDRKVSEANKALYDKTVAGIVVVFVIGMIAIFALSKMYNFSMKDIFIHNCIVLLFVALTEFSFLTYFAKNYDTIDSNYVKYVCAKTVVDRLNA